MLTTAYIVLIISLVMLAILKVLKWRMRKLSDYLTANRHAPLIKLLGREVTDDDLIVNIVGENFDVPCIAGKVFPKKLHIDLAKYHKRLIKKSWSVYAFLLDKDNHSRTKKAKKIQFIRDVVFFLKDFDNYIDFALANPHLIKDIDEYRKACGEDYSSEELLCIMYALDIRDKEEQLATRLTNISFCMPTLFRVNHRFAERGIALPVQVHSR